MSKEAWRWFLGIDISKETFDACCINVKGETVFRIATSMDKEGFTELIAKLSSVSITQESVLIGMESTACYHINLFSYFIGLCRCDYQSSAHLEFCETSTKED